MEDRLSKIQAIRLGRGRAGCCHPGHVEPARIPLPSNCPPGSGETDCTDGIDNDLDLLVDCDDPDCGGDPNCNTTADFCCSGGDSTVWLYCWDTTAGDCVCTIDNYCCTVGWDSTCVDLHINSCSATTCGP